MPATRVFDNGASTSDIRYQSADVAVPSQPYGAGAFAYPEVGGARMLLPDPAPDGEIYLTTSQAAEAMRVKPPAVRRWVKIGYLPEAAPGFYAFSAVSAAEKQARDAESRTRFQQEAA